MSNERHPPPPPPNPPPHSPTPRLSSTSSTSSNRTREAVWQGEDVEEGVGAQEEQAATLAHAEQVRAAQLLTGGQAGQLVRLTRSRTKAARTQAAPSARTSSSHSSSEESEADSSSSNSDYGWASNSRTENKLACKKHVGFPLPFCGVLFY